MKFAAGSDLCTLMATLPGSITEIAYVEPNFVGVPADRLTKISYGKERPQCTDADEACYQKNRRAHLGPGR